MELIDRDIFVKQLEDYIEHTESFDFQMAVIGVVNDLKKQPIVDAIPVSYIQQRIDRLRLLAEYEAEANGGYIGRSSMALFELEELIEYWKKEREQNV